MPKIGVILPTVIIVLVTLAIVTRVPPIRNIIGL